MKGSVSCSRTTGNKRDPYVSIHLEDDTSGVRVVEISIEMADFGNMISGLSFVPCEFKTFNFNLIGKVRENKTERIQCSGTHARAEGIEKAKALEVDGWTFRQSDVENHHNWGGDSGMVVSVPFWRYVDPPTEKEES